MVVVGCGDNESNRSNRNQSTNVRNDNKVVIANNTNTNTNVDDAKPVARNSNVNVKEAGGNANK
jgi:hypothetical protein